MRINCIPLIFLTAAWSTIPCSQGADPKVSPSVTVAFDNRDGRVFLPLKINGTGPHRFMLDTGYDLTMIDSSLAEQLKLDGAGRITIIGIAGRERTRLYRGARFDFNGLNYEPRRVAALLDGRRRNRRGILGSGFYRRFVVEVDYQTEQIILHEPEHYKYQGAGQVLPLTFDNDTPVIRASLSAPGRDPVEFDFEIDTGCDGGLCVGQDILKNRAWLNANDSLRQSNRNGVGGSVETFSGRIPELFLGKLKVVLPSAHFFKDGSPAGDDQAGHIGCEVFRQFKVIFDYSRKQLILESTKAPAQD